MAMALWDEQPALAAALRPLSWAYGLGWWLLQRWHGAEPWKAPVPVISVGNLSVGGTGKSPLVRLIAKRLKVRKPAILLRGYGAAAGPRPLLAGDGRKALASTAQTGDEAQEHAQAGVASVWVDAERRRGAEAALAAGAGALVLDDGFQRRWQIARDLDLLLADWSQLQAGDALLPSGPWREPWSQVKAADAILISGAPEDWEAKRLARALPVAWQGKPVFRLDVQASGLRAWPGGKRTALGALRRKRVAALSGLGRPQRFEASLVALGASVLPWRFADHHPFTAAELAQAPAGAEAIVCTRKDAMRLPAGAKLALPCYVLEAEARVSPAPAFDALLKKALRHA
jgi:tetraacyldisaccharide 4'-kinase